MGALRERWRGVAVAFGLMVVGWFLPWSTNAIVGDGSSWDVLFGEDAVGVASQLVLVAFPLLVVAGLWRVRWSATFGVVAAAVLAVALVAHRARLSDQQVNAIGETATGEMWEEWATTAAGLGLVLWMVASGLLLVVTGTNLVAAVGQRRIGPVAFLDPGLPRCCGGRALQRSGAVVLSRSMTSQSTPAGAWESRSKDCCSSPASSPCSAGASRRRPRRHRPRPTRRRLGLAGRFPPPTSHHREDPGDGARHGWAPTSQLGLCRWPGLTRWTPARGRSTGWGGCR